MSMNPHITPRTWALLLTGVLTSVGCSAGSGSSSTKSTPDFEVLSISVQDGAIWKLNRPIDIAFNKEVDFSTVSLNTLNISTTSGMPATGSFTLLGDLMTVRFQPTCPTLSDSSDAGFLPGGEVYLLHVLGSQSGGITVQSTASDPIEESRSVSFSTPTSTESLALYLDTVPGPPAPLVRNRSGVALDAVNACYLELGDDIENRIYFQWNHITQEGVLEIPDYEVPLNEYSVVENHIAVMLHLNQPVDPADSNLSSALISIQYTDENGEWQDMGTTVTLMENCTESGAAVRLDPIGLLPQGRSLRINVREGFADLVGDRTLLDNTGFALMASALTFDPGTTTVGQGADEYLETFNLSGDVIGSIEDPNYASAAPQADWGGGILKAGFDFSGTGGLNGTFDWHVPAGVDFILSTSSDSILGGPGGAPQLSQSVVNGVVNIRDLVVPANSSIIIQGPNPAIFLCSGTVNVYGRISVDGASSRGVGTLNTTNLPEPGAVGNGGGGTGGTGSFLTTQSTPRGGRGYGAFNQPNGGGQGGETSYGTQGIGVRRGAGGGGGRLGPDYYYEFDGDTADPKIPVRCQEIIGLDAEYGNGGGVEPGRGAESQVDRAQGGFIGPEPFLDTDDTNNFFGSMLVTDPDTGDDVLIRGELDHVWAGGGGGAGGDSVSSSSFPLTPFSISGDEKGSGGGGAAGGVMILSIGEIIVHPLGSITANGGQGGGGENTSGFNRVAGGSGGASGGHIVLSSASYIDVRGVSSEDYAGIWYQDDPNGHGPRPISALGGQGGAGKGNKGGSRFNGVQTPWRCDAIPYVYFANPEGAPNNPPFDDNCFNALPDGGDELGPTLGAGGDGSPGIIQFHVDDPGTNLLFSHELIADVTKFYGGLDGAALDVTLACSPPPLGWHFRDGADIMVPFYGRESTSQSKWIPLGLMRVGPDPDGEGGDPPSDTEIVRFIFGGISTPGGEEFGSVLQDGERQDFGTALVAAANLGASGTTPYVGHDDYTIVMDASAIGSAEDIYLRNPKLLRMFSILIDDGTDETYLSVESASYDVATDTLALTVTADQSIVDVTGPDAATLGSADIQVSLVKHFFLVSTNDETGSYPSQTEVNISFEAAYADDGGAAKESDTWGPTNDPTIFESFKLVDDVERWPDFIRFRVNFNLNTGGGGVDYSSPRPGLEFFRLPTRFGHDSGL